MASPFLADFPPTLGKAAAAGEHYMLIDSYESKNAISSGLNKLSSIGLYIPAGSLSTTYTGNYESKAGGSTAANLGTASGMTGSGRDGEFDLGKLASSLLEKAGKKLLTTADNNGFISAQGQSPNNYMALVYKGPNTFRQHTFAFKFFPKNNRESGIVRSIIEEFRRGTLPRMSSGSGMGLSDSFFKSPRHHKITFCKGGTGASGAGNESQYLFKIGTSVITNMSVNFDPQTVVSFHSDGSPVAIDLSLTFQEIELQISPDNITGQSDTGLADAVLQNQSSSQTTSEQQAASQRRVEEVFVNQAGIN